MRSSLFCVPAKCFALYSLYAVVVVVVVRPHFQSLFIWFAIKYNDMDAFLLLCTYFVYICLTMVTVMLAMVMWRCV